jgi:hypothetical protein
MGADQQAAVQGVHRQLARAEILDCPDRALIGRTFADVAAERGISEVDAFSTWCPGTASGCAGARSWPTIGRGRWHGS